MRPAERIAELIFAYLRDALTPEQERELSEWRNLSTENERFFQEEIDPENIRKTITEMHADKDIVWQKIRKKVPGLQNAPELHDEAEHSHEPLRYWTVSIAAVLLVSLAFSLYFLLRGPWKTQNKTETIASKTPTIVPGGNHAVLTLADGSVIQLDSARTGIVGSQNGSRIEKKDSGEIEYAQGSQTVAGETEYNVLRTPRGGQYSVVLADGSKVWLNAASSIKYPAVFRGPERAVELDGEAYFEVVKNPGSPFRVSVHGLPRVEVLGTEFNIMAYGDEPFMATTLLQGSVRIGGRVLKPGQQARVKSQETEVQILDDIDVGGITAWKNGMTSFRGASIQTIMRAISRWYDVDVAYAGAIPDKRFNGGLPRDTQLPQLLSVLEQSGIHFTVEGKKITVTP